jgi:hypothetical protein
MPELDPGIHRNLQEPEPLNVDGGVKPGHDEQGDGIGPDATVLRGYDTM